MSNKLECPNCGYILNSSEKACKYCGSLNSSFVKVEDKTVNLNRVVNSINSNFNNNHSNQSSQTTKKNNFSCLIFGLLLIFFWPAAIVYLIVKAI